MILEEQAWKWLQKPEMATKQIEWAGRVCYRSHENVTFSSCDPFCKMLIRKGHYSVLEHVSASVLILTNRGVSHELVRHRR